MRQAYDYWQDQPGNFGPDARRLGGELRQAAPALPPNPGPRPARGTRIAYARHSPRSLSLNSASAAGSPFGVRPAGRRGATPRLPSAARASRAGTPAAQEAKRASTLLAPEFRHLAPRRLGAHALPAPRGVSPRLGRHERAPQSTGEGGRSQVPRPAAAASSGQQRRALDSPLRRQRDALSSTEGTHGRREGGAESPGQRTADGRRDVGDSPNALSRRFPTRSAPASGRCNRAGEFRRQRAARTRATESTSFSTAPAAVHPATSASEVETPQRQKHLPCEHCHPRGESPGVAQGTVRLTAAGARHDWPTLPLRFFPGTRARAQLSPLSSQHALPGVNTFQRPRRSPTRRPVPARYRPGQARPGPGRDAGPRRVRRKLTATTGGREEGRRRATAFRPANLGFSPAVPNTVATTSPEHLPSLLESGHYSRTTRLEHHLPPAPAVGVEGQGARVGLLPARHHASAACWKRSRGRRAEFAPQNLSPPTPKGSKVSQPLQGAGGGGERGFGWPRSRVQRTKVSHKSNSWRFVRPRKSSEGGVHSPGCSSGKAACRLAGPLGVEGQGTKVSQHSACSLGELVGRGQGFGGQSSKTGIILRQAQSGGGKAEVQSSATP